VLTWEQYQQSHGIVDEAPAPAPAPAPSPPAATSQGHPLDLGSGQQLDPGRDTDADGLTDAFEQLSGTAAGRADTDGDGLTDGFEVGTARTDPWAIDSDLDGFTDAAELRFGTDPLGAGALGTTPTPITPVATPDPDLATGGLFDQ
jgi:hypothetical protein